MKDFSNVTNPWKEWTIIRQIGRGSFGSVYEIERDAYGFKEKAALKVISVPSSENDLETIRNSNYDVSKWCRSIINDIFREYALMAQLKSCPNIVRCDDCKEIPHEEDEGSDVCIRMELLNPLSKMHREFSQEDVIRIGMDICSALIACGEKNIIHRDIKPDNILVSEEGIYKLGDFGVARELDHTSAASLKGTPTFMAPEVEARREYGRDADIYSLGLVMYWLLNNRRRPFEPVDETPTAMEVQESNGRRLMGEQIPDPVNGSRELKDIILKACKFNRAERYRTPSEMYDALRALADADEQIRTFRGEPAFAPEMTEVEDAEEYADETMALTVKAEVGDAEDCADESPSLPAEPAVETDKKAEAPARKGKPKGLMIGILAAVVVAVIGIVVLKPTGSGDDKMAKYIKTIVAERESIDENGYPVNSGYAYKKYAADDFNADGKKDYWLYSDWTLELGGDKSRMSLLIQGDKVPDDTSWQNADRMNSGSIDLGRLSFYDNGIVMEQWKDGDISNTQIFIFPASENSRNVLFEKGWLLADSIWITVDKDKNYSCVPVDSINGAEEGERITLTKEEANQLVQEIIGDGIKIDPEIHDFAEELDSLS